MKKSIVLCGLGRLGWRVLEDLRAAGMDVVAIDTNCRPEDSRLRGVRLVAGDCRKPEVLAEADVASATGVLLLTSDDLVNLTAALAARALNKDVRVVLRMYNQNLLQRLGKAVRNVHALSTSLLTAPVLAQTAVTGQGLGTFRLDEGAAGVREVVEVEVVEGSDLVGRSLLGVIEPRSLQLVAHIPRQGPARFLLDVDPEAALAVGDRVILCGPHRELATLLAGSNRLSDALRWAGKLRRTLRVVRRTLAELDMAVAACTLTLLLVVLISTVVLHLGVPQYSLADGLFRTISVMATGAPLPEAGVSDWLKVFVSGLRIFGLALTGVFTAAVTNYLLRARLGGALEVRRVPDGGHIIICGLSPIGFRVVEELIAWGERVVVIETDPNNRFTPTARRLGAAVISGDAAVPEVLRQARAATAKAVIAATNNDVINLEVALLVRELNERQRVVLLLSDPQLAQMMREAANVRLAVSVPALAGPAFVAALLGDRVRNILLVHDRMLALVDLEVHEGDAVLNKAAVRTVAVDYRLLPLAVVPAQGPAPRTPLAARLGVGDRLVGLVGLADLDRLVRRQPSSAAFAVEVTSFLLPTRAWLAGLVRTHWNLSAEDAEQTLDRLPLRFEDLTRGQAEELLGRLLRERVTARVCPTKGLTQTD
jgi:Trk K+ transport system NAD-binding subunit